jgi:hypothetical protein
MTLLPNYFLLDFLGSVLAFLLFPLVFVFPGYICAYILDLFDFRKRLLVGRITISVVISLACSPILLFLTYRLASVSWAISLLGILAAISAVLIWSERKKIFAATNGTSKFQKLAVWILIGWSLFAIVSLVDIQIGDRLYYSAISFDYTTRASIINSITRTGVPPITPGYFIGQPVRLTFLYYFWYIPCSFIDLIGGSWVDARMAMIASAAWCGIGLMCTIALYLQVRNPDNRIKIWKKALLGIGALTISGLDIYPASIFMLASRFTFGSMWPEGDIEHWNEQITAWLGAVSWVPHHVASLIVCIVGFLLIQHSRGKEIKNQIAAAFIAGLAFASASGLSIYITAVFVIFWIMWVVLLFLDKKNYRTILMMILTGIFASIAISPFLRDLLSGGSSAAPGSFPFIFQVRVFRPLFPFLLSYPEIIKNLVNLAFLPLNYFLELGFYFIVGYLWLYKNWKTAKTTNAFYLPEILLLSASAFVGTFIRSTLIANNDLGWRSWMFGQFVLLIWAVDVGQEFLAENSFKTYLTSKSNSKNLKHGRLLAQLMVVGMLTTVFSLLMLRLWPIFIDVGISGVPVDLSPDTQLGKRTFAARRAYEYIRDTLPTNVVVQYNPTIHIDRPSGLYGTRQMVVADYSSYGVPLKVFEALQHDVGLIFENKENSWDEIDQNCERHYIDVIILNDLDPVWLKLPDLMQQRKPLYQNSYYAIFPCGNFSKR